MRVPARSSLQLPAHLSAAAKIQLIAASVLCVTSKSASPPMVPVRLTILMDTAPPAISALLVSAPAPTPKSVPAKATSAPSLIIHGANASLPKAALRLANAEPSLPIMNARPPAPTASAQVTKYAQAATASILFLIPQPAPPISPTVFVSPV